MLLLQDTREQHPLEFPHVVGVEIKVGTLEVGDYGAWHGGVRDSTVIERKGLGDLFHSFTASYEAERAKIIKAESLGLKYIVSIESSFTDLLKGHVYWKDGELRESRKSGMALIRQLSTIQRHYPWVSVWYCTSRKEMAWRILEFFLAAERCRIL